MALAVAAALSDYSGLVVDPSGSLVAGASVKMTSTAGDSRTETSDTFGAFRFRDLRPGDYQLAIAREGFKPLGRRVNVGARPGAPRRFDLELAALEQKLTVSAADVQVGTEASENMDVVKLDRKALDSLPVLGNNIIRAASDLLDAGAVGAGGVSIVVDGVQT
jgi:hypothetical protein